MKQRQYDIRPEVINYDDIRKMIPFFDGKPELVAKIMHFLRLDEVNRVHSTYCDTPGILSPGNWWRRSSSSDCA